jgi:arylsulfatase A
MKNKKVVSVISIVLMLASIFTHASETQKPNIIIMFADDLGYADLGSYGNPYIRTPNLDQMAQEGQRWTDFYVAAPVCSPSRGALLTGQYPVRSGLYGKILPVMHPGDTYGVPQELTTLPEALKTAGYATGMFGKWHLGDAQENFPTRNGFDYWYGPPYSNDMDRVGAPPATEIFKAMKNGSKLDNNQMNSFAKTIELFKDPKEEYWNVPLYRSQVTGAGYKDEIVKRPVVQSTLTRELTEEAIKFMTANKDKPFLVYMPYAMPHLPVFASEKFKGKSKRGQYGDAVEELDWSAGEIKRAVQSLGLADNTIILFTSDNGPWQAVSTLNAGTAGVLHGSKGQTWEGGMRVPAVFWGPGFVQHDTISDIGSTLDVFATALSLAGVSLPDGVDGYSLENTLNGSAASPREELAYYRTGQLQAYRKGNYKLHLYSIPVLYSGEKSVKFDEPVLYDLRQDIGEMKNIAADHPEVVADILKAIEKHQAGVTIASPLFDRRMADY